MFFDVVKNKLKAPKYIKSDHFKKISNFLAEIFLWRMSESVVVV